MQDEVIFLPDRRGPSLRHVAWIAAGFFVFAQLLFLEGLGARLAFSLVFAVFLLLGLVFAKRHAGNWAQRIVVNRAGISYEAMRAQHGVDAVPWQEVARMDLFYTDPRLPPHLRIGLHPGAFQQRLRKGRLQGLGLDINVPVAVNATAEEVLETAQAFWRVGARRSP